MPAVMSIVPMMVAGAGGIAAAAAVMAAAPGANARPTAKAIPARPAAAKPPARTFLAPANPVRMAGAGDAADAGTIAATAAVIRGRRKGTGIPAAAAVSLRRPAVKPCQDAPHRAQFTSVRLTGGRFFVSPAFPLLSSPNPFPKMSDLIVHGGRPLSGTIIPSGNKNSVLPVLCATLLTDAPVTLTNVPHITDVEKLAGFFTAQGSRLAWDQAAGTMRLDHTGFEPRRLADGLPDGMRSSVLLFAPLLRRMKKLSLSANAKGCALGVRELDPHLEILAKLGAKISRARGGLTLSLPKNFRGARHWPDYMSVTATENFLMAAVLADGDSVLINAASEPHVQDLCAVLNAMGARITGIGTSQLAVSGVSRLHGGTFTISTDYHEVVTFLALGAITGGEVRVRHSVPQHFDLIARAFGKLGVIVEHHGDTALVRARQKRRIAEPFTSNLLPKIEAAPWPYFPVDLLPLMVALSTRCDGTMHFWNKVYENGFSWIPELAKFGAHAVVSDPHRIIVFGNRPLRPAEVVSPYVIRAAVALTMVAASIPGRSIVKNADTIRRAHPNFVENLRTLGARLEWK